MDKDLKPTKIEKIYCPTCKALVLKIYPDSPYRIGIGQHVNCRKCIQKFRDREKGGVSK